MKKTLVTLLILALVASVCGAMFASATDPVEELKAELEALVGPDAADAEFDWVFDVETDKAGLVTVTLTVDNVNDKNVTFVGGFFYYNVNELTLLNDVAEDSGLIDCITSMPADFENLSVTYAEKGAEGFETVPGVLVMNVVNAGDSVLSADEPLEITLKFQMADGVNLAGMYIPTDSVAGSSHYDPILGNGAYGIAIREVDEPTTSDPEPETSDPEPETSDPEPVTSDPEPVTSDPEDSSSEEPEDSSSEEPEDSSSEEPEDSSSEEPEDSSSEEPEDSSSEEPEDSSEVPVTSSEDTSSEPPTPGDAGVTLFVILGVLALAGAAVAIKVRN